MGKERQNAKRGHTHRWMLALTVAYMIEGKTKKDVAALLGVNEKSVASWLNKSPQVWEQLQAYICGLIDFPFEDNLSVFMAYLMIKQHEAYRSISAYYINYIAPFKLAKTLPREKIKEIVSLVNKGYSQPEIAEHMQINIKTVVARLNKAFIYRDEPNDSIDYFMQRLQRKQNMQSYNKLLLLHNEYIVLYKKANTPHLQQVRETIVLFKNGVQKKEIAKQFDVNEKTVARWIEEYRYLA